MNKNENRNVQRHSETNWRTLIACIIAPSLNSEPMDGDDQLTAQLYKHVTYKSSKLGQTDLVFGLWSEFDISVFALVGFQVCTYRYSGYFMPG